MSLVYSVAIISFPSKRPSLLPPHQLFGCFVKISPSNLSSFSDLPLSILGQVHGHALTALEPSNYLSNDIGRFSEILTPADAGACQEVLDQTYSNVITPMKKKDRERIKGERD